MRASFRPGDFQESPDLPWNPFPLLGAVLVFCFHMKQAGNRQASSSRPANPLRLSSLATSLERLGCVRRKPHASVWSYSTSQIEPNPRLEERGKSKFFVNFVFDDWLANRQI